VTSRIRVLPEEVVGGIAAGEVVDRPASALKELVENALDAGAHRVEVGIVQGGMRRLEVVDDGQGMEPEDLPLALRRHATSKISSLDDLSRLATYGFRGEALAALAGAAGRLVLASRTPTGTGAQVVVEAGRVGPVQPAATALGTRVTAEDLFAQLPARRAFLRSPAAEAAACVDVVVRLALAAPQVAMRLRTEAGERLVVEGSGDRADVLTQVYGPTLRQGLLPVHHEGPGIRVTGYLADVSHARTTRRGQTLLVLGRPVESRSLTYAVESAYQGRLPRGRFPVFVLLVEVDPRQVDVNVHPQKRLVRFADEGWVARAVHGACRRALQEARPAWAFPSPPPPPPPPPAPLVPGSWLAVPSAPVPRAREEGPRPTSALLPAPTARGPTPPWVPRRLVAVRQVRLTYLLAESPEGLCVVDQHAAGERLRWEELTGALAHGSRLPRQRLLEPAVVEVGEALAERAVREEEALRRLGYEVQAFGPGHVRLHAVPSQVRHPTRVFVDLLESWDQGGQDPEYRRLALLACHSAVRAGDPLSLAEQQALLDGLVAAQDPGSCPHGRPTVHLLAWEEVARWFARRG
jgi:DNA mismatch repair protein MutL